MTNIMSYNDKYRVMEFELCQARDSFLMFMQNSRATNTFLPTIVLTLVEKFHTK